MTEPIRSIVVVGGGSAGFLAALTLRRMLPRIPLTVVHSPDIPVIGVGESTTSAIAVHLHQHLGLDQSEFHREVRPSWKLGLRFEWGAADVPHFNYTFDRYLDKNAPGLSKWLGYYCLTDTKDASTFYALMDRDKSPAALKGSKFSLDPRTTYHLPNKRFIAYLQRKSEEAGATVIADEVLGVVQDESGDVATLKLKSGREIAGDLFIDCSGFGSLLLGKTLEEPSVSYQDALFCDRAVVGSWERDDAVKPYTTISTMEHGWAWRIEFAEAVTRGYVYSSGFVSDEDAAQELKEKNPELGEDPDLRVLRFPSGRRERNVVRNVVAVGNASGFVEPLEATSLHLIVEQLNNLALGLIDTNHRLTPSLRDLLNTHFVGLWDDVRDFLALHYKYNFHSDSPFWRHCREETPLGRGEDLVEMYRELGPSRLLGRVMHPGGIFGLGGYLAMLVGMQLPTDARVELTPAEVKAWRAVQDGHRKEAAQTLAMRPALERAYGNGAGAGAAAESVPVVGRNAACPCGSGKKYKFCHAGVR